MVAAFRLRVCVGVLLNLTLLNACALGIAQAQPFGHVLSAAFGELAVPGLAYAVVEDGVVVESGGVGLADVSTGEPVTARTPFRVASLTKPIAAALLLNDVFRDNADLDTPLRRASPRFREGCEAMQRYFRLHQLPYLEGISCEDDGLLLRHVLSHTAKAPPGSEFAYNGFLFGLLSDAGVAAPGETGDESFVRAVRQRMILPLGLRDTAAGVDDSEGAAVVARLAAPHHQQNGRWVVGPPIPDPLNAGAGLIASAEDMAEIDSAFQDRLAVNPAVWAWMTTPTTLADGARSPYALGWFVQEVGGREIVWHYGHQPEAYSGLWIRDADNRRSLVILANSDGLADGYMLSKGDITRSPVARLFLDWSSGRDN